MTAEIGRDGNALKKLLKFLGIVLLVVVVAAAGLIGYLTATEFNPDPIEPVEVTAAARSRAVKVGEMLKIVTFNTGYAGLDRTQDFFMDGGTGVKPESKERVNTNLAGILGALNAQNAQVYFLQETDVDSARTYGVNEVEYYRHGLSLNTAFAANYKTAFVPYPWPPIGRVHSGLTTLTELQVTEATRESLPVPFQWPLRIANLKRCMLVERVPVEGTDKELVLVNFHLEAYDDGEGKVAQTRQLVELMKAEYRNGNYVIAGGDFNQTFAEAAHIGGSWEGKWTPGVFAEDELPHYIKLVYDGTRPSCRSLDQPYTGDRKNHAFYLIDGFLMTDNVKLNHVETVDLNFEYSDHNPVMVQVTLQ